MNRSCYTFPLQGQSDHELNLKHWTKINLPAFKSSLSGICHSDGKSLTNKDIKSLNPFSRNSYINQNTSGFNSGSLRPSKGVFWISSSLYFDKMARWLSRTDTANLSMCVCSHDITNDQQGPLQRETPLLFIIEEIQWSYFPRWGLWQVAKQDILKKSRDWKSQYASGRFAISPWRHAGEYSPPLFPSLLCDTYLRKLTEVR